MFKNTNHNIMPRAKKSAHLAGGMVVVNGQSAFVRIKSADGASIVLSSKGFSVPLGRDTVAAFEFFAPFNFASLRRALVAVNSFTTRLSLAVSFHVRSLFGAEASLFVRRSHSVLLTGGLRLSSYNPVRNMSHGC